MTLEQEDPIYLQRNLFSDDLMDTRTREQKRRAQALHAPMQEEMFSPQEVVYQRVNPHPQMPIPDHMTVPFLWTETRTSEEIEADILREAAKRTIPMFPELELLPSVISNPAFLLQAPKVQLLLAARSVVPEQLPQPPAAHHEMLIFPIWDTFKKRERQQNRDGQFLGRLLAAHKAAFEHLKPPSTTIYPPAYPEQRMHSPDHFIPIGWISIADVVAGHPNLATEIHSLSDDEFDLIVENVYEVLQDTYRDTFEELLLDFLAWKASVNTTEEIPISRKGTGQAKRGSSQHALPFASI